MTRKIATTLVLGVCAACLIVAGVAGVYDKHRREAPPHATTGFVESQIPASPDQPVVGTFHVPDNVDVDDDGTEIVLGLKVRKDRNCRVELNDYVTPDGEMFSAYSCTPHEPRALGRFDHYDNETLAELAYSDPAAAAELGERVMADDKPRAYKLLVRAAALDGGDYRRLAWLADQAFSAVSVDGAPQIDNLESFSRAGMSLSTVNIKEEYWSWRVIRSSPQSPMRVNTAAHCLRWYQPFIVLCFALNHYIGEVEFE